jgi:sensor histidine kinase YesM
MNGTTRREACRPLAWHGVVAVIFNSGIAALLAVVGFGGGLGVNLVFSQCIGLPAWFLIDGGRKILWPGRKPPIIGFAILVLVSMLVASLGGTALATSLLGIPWMIDTYLTSLMITAVAGFVASLYFWEREKVAGLEAAAAWERSRFETVERQIAQAQLKLLQAQIEPHFLFNTLANLRALIPLDPSRAQSMLDHLDGFLRTALAAARKDQNTLGDEFGLLRDYLEILAIRMDKRLSYRLDLPAELAAEEVPPMLLQPLVENAVRHGLEPTIEGGEVSISARAANGALAITVSDTGIGMRESSNPGTGLGLAHVRERLAAAYGDKAKVEIRDNAGGGVAITLAIPRAAK